MLVIGRCPRLAGASTLDDNISDFTALLNNMKKDESGAQDTDTELEMPEWVDRDEYGNPTRIQPRLVATRLSMDSLNMVSGAEYVINTRLYDQMKNRETGEVDQQLVLDEFSDSFVSAFNDARKKMHVQLFDTLKKDDILQQAIPDTGELFGTEYDFDSSVDVDPKYDYRLDPDQFDLRFFVDAASMPFMSRITNATVKYITKGESEIVRWVRPLFLSRFVFLLVLTTWLITCKLIGSGRVRFSYERGTERDCEEIQHSRGGGRETIVPCCAL